MVETFHTAKMTDVVLLQLVRSIVAGELPQGSNAPTEEDLTNQFGISKAAAREITRVLSALGMILVHQGKRSVVCPQEEWQILSPVVQQALRLEWGPKRILEQLFEARLILEPAATALAAQRSNPDDLEGLRSLIQDMEQIAQTSGDLQALLSVDRLFHDAIARLVGNEVVRAMVRDLHVSMVENWSDSKVEASDLPTVVEQHQDILASLIAKDTERASSAARIHIETARSIELGRRNEKQS